MTMAAAIRMCTFPVVISSVTGENGRNRRSAARIGRAIQTSSPRLSAHQSPAKTVHGSRVAGHIACAKAGE